MKNILALFCLALIFSQPALAEVLKADLLSKQGDVVGSIKLRQGTEGVLLNIKAENLPPGYHGMHFHSVAACDHSEGFKTAKGHVDPDKKPHGFLNEKGPHEGNLPNLIVSKDGTVEVELYTSLVSLNDGKANLLDKDGSALIIHENKDDHITQPIGGSGGRIACAKIVK